ncbi:MAG: TauD/TfdA family dioxygenase [Burkholderiaceae bacterium]
MSSAPNDGALAGLIRDAARAGFELRPLTRYCGAEIMGLDLSATLAAPVVAGLRAALAERGVLFFREQTLTPQRQAALARQFGEIVVNPIYEHVAGHPEVMPVVKEANDQYNIGDTWHSDMSYMPQPPLGSMLYARELPPYGGDTLFVNMTAVYEHLSDGMKGFLDGRRAVHSDRFLSDRRDERNAGRSTRLREDLTARIEALHPVVRTHDESGRKALFVNGPFTWAFEGMTREESRPILDELMAQAMHPEFGCRFRWSPGALAFWDNRCALHYACNDYHGFRREMHRVTIAGGVPV